MPPRPPPLTITTSLTATPEALAAAATAAGVAVAEIKVGGEECVYTGVQSDGSHIVLTCTMPAHDTGIYDVAVVVPAYGTEYFIASGLEYKHYVKTTFDFWNIEYMQDMTAEVCNEIPKPQVNATTSKKLNRGEQKELGIAINRDTSIMGGYEFVPETTLKDRRDGREYIVRKLADGNCWMAQNLELNLYDDVELTSEDTDLAEGRSWTPENTSQNGVYGSWSQYGENVARSYSPTMAGEASLFLRNGTTLSPTGEPYERLGNYYNWYAITAGIGTTSFTGNADQSICPKNWQLPVDDGSTSKNKTYLYLTNTIYASKSFLGSPMNFVYSGIYHLTSIGYRQSDPYYASGVAANTTTPYSVNNGSGKFKINTGTQKGFGFTCRCVNR